MKYRSRSHSWMTNTQIINSWSKRNSSSQWINEARERGSWTRFMVTKRAPYHRFLYQQKQARQLCNVNRSFRARMFNREVAS
jgi:hypothetical protein